MRLLHLLVPPPLVRSAALLLASLCLLTAPAAAQGTAAAPLEPFAIEYYYKTRWGAADEFWRLFEKNHLPILQHEKARGRILDIRVTTPVNHGTEDGRWDFRVTLVYRDVVAAHESDPAQAAWIRERYPDQETFQREEQRRFELLLAHWDLPVRTRVP
jgi:hypothetical protein